MTDQKEVCVVIGAGVATGSAIARAFAREGYQKNVIVFRSVSLVARSAASIPWKLRRRGQVGAAPGADHPLLRLLRQPNPRMGGAEFLEEVLGFFLLSGNAFIECIAQNADANPLELWPLRADLISVVTGPKGLPRAYLFNTGAQERRWPDSEFWQRRQ